MKKLFQITIVSLLLTACGESETVSKLKKICEEDVKRSSVQFDCGCQVGIFKDAMTSDQMALLVKFIETEKTNKDEALNISKTQEFGDLFNILVSKAPDIEKNCRKQ